MQIINFVTFVNFAWFDRLHPVAATRESYRRSKEPSHAEQAKSYISSHFSRAPASARLTMKGC